MTAPPPRRPWWKRKRARAALLVWLLVAYPATAGPASYGTARGWSPPFVHPLYGPLRSAMPFLPFRRAIDGYCEWWVQLGYRHAASD